MKNLYKLYVEDYVALSTKVKKAQSHDVDELWNIRLGHFHNGAFTIMLQITIGLPKGSLEQQDV